MRKVSITLLLVGSVSLFQYCSSTKKAAAPVATYDKDILPVIQASCAPCHIAGKGNKLPIDNYAKAKEFAADIIERIQKNPGDHGFMPMRNPKLSDATIALFVAWKDGGLQEK
jgi:mono/diheme cytochrome c family protein